MAARSCCGDAAGLTGWLHLRLSGLAPAGAKVRVAAREWAWCWCWRAAIEVGVVETWPPRPNASGTGVFSSSRTPKLLLPILLSYSCCASRVRPDGVGVGRRAGSFCVAAAVGLARAAERAPYACSDDAEEAPESDVTEGEDAKPRCCV